MKSTEIFRPKICLKKWPIALRNEFSKDYMKEVETFLLKEQKRLKIYPENKDLFSAFKMTGFKDLKVVIIGQDPYHGENQAHGLSFSVKNVKKIPPSLKNIFKELERDLGLNYDHCSGNLESWAKQGVLLLNNVLSVEEKKPGSHKKCGWEVFTDFVVNLINTKNEKIVFLLWGAHAQTKGQFIDRTKHYVLETTHPSPFSAYRGFLGCDHFSKTNDYLEKNNIETIDWSLK